MTKIKTALVMAIVLAAELMSFAMSHTSAGLEAPQNTSNRKTKVDVRYDKKTSITTVQLEGIVLWKNPNEFEEVSMIVGFDYPKRTIITPKFVSLGFLAATRNWDPFPAGDVVAVLDGSRFNVGKMETRKGGDLYRARDIIERRRLSISYEDFSRIAKAKTLAILLGDSKYDLSDHQLQLLRDFLELMQQEGQEFK